MSHQLRSCIHQLKTMPPNETTLNFGQVEKEDSFKYVSTLVLFVNGKKVEIDNPTPSMTLLSYLRRELGLTGTKLGCGEGGCGACTVMLSFLTDRGINHISANACLTPLCSLHGIAVTTVEGIGSTKSRLHQVQKQIADNHGSQCGFCTPGMVMSMFTLLRNNHQPRMADIETYFQGNLCRCTGYRPIMEGYGVFAIDANESGNYPGCGKTGQDCCMNELNEIASTSSSISNSVNVTDPNQELIFPPELKCKASFWNQQSLIFGNGSSSTPMTWYRPTILTDLLRLKTLHPAAKIVVGNTELGIEMKFKKQSYPVMIQPNQIHQLTQMKVTSEGLIVGAAVTLSALETQLEAIIADYSSYPKHGTQTYQQIIEMLRWFAGKQIRNVGSIGGNIITGSPISDLNPILMASKCSLTLASLVSSSPNKGVEVHSRQVVFDHAFYSGYRTTILERDEVLVSVMIPFNKEDEHFVAFKQARRRDDDIAIVNGAFYFRVNSTNNIVMSSRMAYGGLAATTKMALKTSDFLQGRTWCPETFDQAMAILLEDFPLPPNVPGAMVRYRQTLALSLLLKSFLFLSNTCHLYSLPSSDQSAATTFHKNPLQGSQIFDIIPNQVGAFDPLRKPLKHNSADKQASGEAIYVDDIPMIKGELHLAFVLSTKAHANITCIDESQALQVPGVSAFFCHKDIDADCNQYTMVLEPDEVLFAQGYVQCVGQIIGVILADTPDNAAKAVGLVRVSYEDLEAVITIEQAIAKGSYFTHFGTGITNSDDIQSDLEISDTVVCGQLTSGAQEHFYMEPQCCLAIPSEADEMLIYAATQSPYEAQRLAAHVLNIPMSKVTTRVKRLGGGFGGKETRCMPLIMAAAFAASRTSLPVRVCLDRDQDMLMCGHRHPFLTHYKVGCTQNGSLNALEAKVYTNAGYSLDLSFAVLHRAMFNLDNGYKLPKVDIKGYCCKTNLQSNTAFRGFGGPQGLLVVENFMDDIACELDIDPTILREKNLLEEGDQVYYSQVLNHCTLQRCWAECKLQSSFNDLKTQVDSWNAVNRWKKRGLSMIPCKFGIAFTGVHMNQGAALVQVYTDGSVALSHGGIEMGQGLYTKTMQVASKILNVPMSMIHIVETGTDKVPNTSPTAASTGTDLNGMAVKIACEKILRRIKHIRDLMPSKEWKDWIAKAYMERISLSATGFYATPDIGYDWETNQGNPFGYFVYGVAASLVEIDCLTGDHNVLKTDIVMDVGESINPAIDIGQIEGAFAQGYGLFMMEQMMHSPDGVLLTRGPGAYKIPGFGDMPSEFNVSLLRGAPNPKAVFSSKAVGEPPLFLAASVFFAVKEAIRSARVERGLSKKFTLDAPATAERIRMACEDHITARVPQLPSTASFKPWGIQL